jgi:hypothetical protein
MEWYIQNYDNPVINYPIVKHPGKLIRNWYTGDHVMRLITIKEYFTSLGVLELFDPNDPSSLKIMQYHSMNPWGFVGYQIGEAILITTGYYHPEKVTIKIRGVEYSCERYYCGSPDNSVWKYGNSEVVHGSLETDKTIIAKDVNSWKGEFTGKNGIHSLADLMEPKKQEIIIRDIMWFNLKAIKNKLFESGLTIDHIKEKKWTINSADNMLSFDVRCSISGILASAHLCGAQGVLNLLNSEISMRDELGTSILKYMADYCDYETIFE